MPELEIRQIPFALALSGALATQLGSLIVDYFSEGVQQSSYKSLRKYGIWSGAASYVSGWILLALGMIFRLDDVGVSPAFAWLLPTVGALLMVVSTLILRSKNMGSKAGTKKMSNFTMFTFSLSLACAWTAFLVAGLTRRSSSVASLLLAFGVAVPVLVSNIICFRLHNQNAARSAENLWLLSHTESWFIHCVGMASFTMLIGTRIVE